MMLSSFGWRESGGARYCDLFGPGRGDDLEVSAGLEFPTDKHLDRRIGLIETGHGEYLAELPLRSGQWDVVIEANERLFRSRDRVTLR